MSETPLYPLEGVISWNMNTTCNYRCSYCTQRFVEDRGRWAEDLPGFLRAFAALPGDWEIKLSGGEPFRHPGFMEAVSALIAAGLRVSVVTNLSSSREVLQDYVTRVAGRPGVISASWHHEYVAAEALLDKVRWLQDLHQGGVHVTCVATQARLPALRGLRDRFAEAGVTLKVQPEKQDRAVIGYSAQERQELRALGGHNGLGWISPSFQGRLCWAGARYLIVDHRGEVYRCYPARRLRQERLGNLLDGSFRLRAEATPCRYSYCNCTVPTARGMVNTQTPEETWPSLAT